MIEHPFAKIWRSTKVIKFSTDSSSKDDNWSQSWWLFENLKFWIVTLETSVIRIIKFSRNELYLPISNDAMLSQWYYYVPSFKFLAAPQLLPSLPQLTQIWEMLTISNYCTPHPPIPNWWFELGMSTPSFLFNPPANLKANFDDIK